MAKVDTFCCGQQQVWSQAVKHRFWCLTAGTPDQCRRSALLVLICYFNMDIFFRCVRQRLRSVLLSSTVSRFMSTNVMASAHTAHLCNLNTVTMLQFRTCRQMDRQIEGLICGSGLQSKACQFSQLSNWSGICQGGTSLIRDICGHFKFVTNMKL